MGTIALPIPWVDFHRAGHPPAFAYGQPTPCPVCVWEKRAEEEDSSSAAVTGEDHS